MSPPPALVLDAGAIFCAKRHDGWTSLLESYELVVPATVVRREARFYREKGSERRVEIDLTEAVEEGRITEYTASAAEVAGLREQFDRSFRARLDPGEVEALVHLDDDSTTEACLVTGDGPAVEAAAMLGFSEQVVSLETALRDCGITKALPREHSENFVTDRLEEGRTRRIQGRGLRG